MLKLSLVTYDVDGNKIPALSIDGVVPQQISSLLAFIQPGMRFEVSCSIQTQDNKQS